MAVGSASALVPTYLSELSPAKIRGGVSTMFQLMIMTGILLAYISNYALKGVSGNWHWMLGLATVPAALLFIGGLFLPESPRFLVRHDNEAGAREILGMINDDPNSIEAEISDIQFNILKTCSKYLKKNGTLVYSTCSMLKEENDAIIEKFIKEEKFETVNIEEQIPNEFSKITTNNMVQFLPSQNHDGFFITMLKKI